MSPVQFAVIRRPIYEAERQVAFMAFDFDFPDSLPPQSALRRRMHKMHPVHIEANIIDAANAPLLEAGIEPVPESHQLLFVRRGMSFDIAHDKPGIILP